MEDNFTTNFQTITNVLYWDRLINAEEIADRDLFTRAPFRAVLESRWPEDASSGQVFVEALFYAS